MDLLVILLITGISVGALYFLLASGLALIYGLMNILSFAHGAFLAVGAYVGWLILSLSDTKGSTWLFLLALLTATLAGGVLGLLTEVLLIRPLYNRAHLDQLLVTIGLGFVIVALFVGIAGGEGRLMNLPGWMKDTTDIFGAMITNDRFVIIGAAALVFSAIMLFLGRSRHGLIVRAGVENREMVRALGIDVRRSFTLVFTVGGLAAGLGGALTATTYGSVTPHIGDNVLLFGFIVLIIGGVGSIPGALIAAIIVGCVQQLANYFIGPGAGDLLVLVLMTLILLFRPQGLLGRKGRIV